MQALSSVEAGHHFRHAGTWAFYTFHPSIFTHSVAMFYLSFCRRYHLYLHSSRVIIRQSDVALMCMNQSAFRASNLSTTCKSVSAEPTFPGKTTYGSPGHLLVFSSHLHMGTPGAAWPMTSARRIRSPLVAQSEEVMPPFSAY